MRHSTHHPALSPSLPFPRKREPGGAGPPKAAALDSRLRGNGAPKGPRNRLPAAEEAQ
ncbi:hypothetical protein GCM10009090_31280 [[Pseudomonas] boreopolis]|uniref:Uncharacterized protein n=1 Tax=Xanthomonas boreopolis TaxID=86183 RepID=A0A919KJ71_9XANT|nr:hypothetical protein GCM10009090_31280 [[Pseudomonas] boreopolis]